MDYGDNVLYITYYDISKWCRNTDNHKWIVLTFLFFVVDMITTTIGLHYELMIELNPLIQYLILHTSLGISILILGYFKYVFLTIMYTIFPIMPYYTRWALFYTIFIMSAFVAGQNIGIIIKELII